MLGVECWVLGVECWVLGVGCWGWVLGVVGEDEAGNNSDSKINLLDTFTAKYIINSSLLCNYNA